MLEDSFTEVTSQSWGSRLGGSIKGIIGGFIAVAIGIGVLWWNEGRTVKRTRSLEEGQGNVQTIDTKNLPEGLQNNNIVHFSGTPEVRDSLEDSQFNVKTKAISLSRRVEMYQWVENEKKDTKKKLGGGTETTTTYTYKKEWSSRAIESSEFKKPVGHQNPGSIPYEDESFQVEEAPINDVQLASSTISQINCGESLSLKGMKISGDPKKIENRGTQIYVYANTNHSSTQIGDVRIKYSRVPVGPISVVSSLMNNTTTDYQAEDGTVHLVECGLKTSEAMFTTAHESNSMWAWILRGVGFFLIFGGFRSIFKVISVVADVLPFLGNIAGVGIGIISGVLTIVVGLVTVAIAWVFFRPVLGISLLVIAAAAVGFLIYRKKQKTPEVSAG